MDKSDLNSYEKVLELRQHALTAFERQLINARNALTRDQETLETLQRYQKDYSSLNAADWKGQSAGSVPSLLRLQNGSRFLANLQLAVSQQESKVAESNKKYETLLSEWKIKYKEKQKLNEVVDEKSRAFRQSRELKLEQQENDEWVASREQRV